MRTPLWGVLFVGLLTCILANHAGGAAATWQETVRQIHTRFQGRAGTFAQFGDSITVTQAFWSPLRGERRNAPPLLEQAFARVNTALRPECWREWKGPEFGSEGGQTTRWAKEQIDAWLRKLNPEAAVILFGSNDLHSLEVEEYRTNLRAVLQRCQENGTVPILTTPPPRHGLEQKAERFAQAVRDLAAEWKLPLVDYHAEILKRRPTDWDGSLPQFQGQDTYEVPTLISRDGVHPSFPTRFQNDYSEEALRTSGYTLRNYLTLLTYAELLSALQAAPVLATRAAEATTVPPSQPWFPKAPPLRLATDGVLRVSTMAQLYKAAATVKPGGTILLAPGRYVLGAPLEIRTDRVTLRGETNDRNRVVIDGSGNAPGAPGEAVRLTACKGVTIADLTVENVRWNGIKINSETGVQDLCIYNCVLHNIWQRAVKGVKVPAANREKLRPRGGRVKYCLFYNDHPKQFNDDSSDTAENFNGDYIGGIDLMSPAGWVIRDNVFVGIQGRTRQARGAIFLWQDARDCIVERNVMVDCDSGICLGNGQPPEPGEIHCTGFMVRNNFLTRAPENGILADYTRDCRILHNTIHHPDSRLRRGIRLVDDNNGLLVANNLLSGPKVLVESKSRMMLRNNHEDAPVALFLNATEGNLRLKEPAASIVNTAEQMADVTDDIDRRPRGNRTDLGAHEFSQD